MANKNSLPKLNHRWAFPIGLLVVLLSSIGIVAIVMFSVGKINDIKTKNQAESYQKYIDFLSPIVMIDPEPFDDVTSANNNQLLDMAIWSILRNDKAPGEYDSALGGIALPQSIVADQITAMFGSDVVITHETVSGYGYQFKYDIASECYVIPVTSIENIYTPEIENVEKRGDSINLTVGYLSGNDWVQDSKGNLVAPEPAKYMKITLRKNGDSFYLLSIRDTDAPETANSQD